MVNLVTGDLFDSEAQTLVNAVNCAGVMGKGIALAFKRQFPEMFAEYSERCKDGLVRLGEPYLYRGESFPWVLNFPTKSHWRSVSKLEDIVAGLAYLEAHYRAWGITSLAVPRSAVALASSNGMSLARRSMTRLPGWLSLLRCTRRYDGAALYHNTACC